MLEVHACQGCQRQDLPRLNKAPSDSKACEDPTLRGAYPNLSNLAQWSPYLAVVCFPVSPSIHICSTCPFHESCLILLSWLTREQGPRKYLSKENRLLAQANHAQVGSPDSLAQSPPQLLTRNALPSQLTPRTILVPLLDPFDPLVIAVIRSVIQIWHFRRVVRRGIGVEKGRAVSAGGIGIALQISPCCGVIPARPVPIPIPILRFGEKKPSPVDPRQDSPSDQLC
jgi:hypothetical protein